LSSRPVWPGRLRSGFIARPDQKERPGRAETFDIGRAAFLEHKMLSGKIVERLTDLDAPGFTMRFHARGDVYRIAPDVVGKAGIADHACGRRAAMDAGAQAELAAPERWLLRDHFHHGKRQMTDRDGTLDLPSIESGRRHITVADGLDLVGPILLTER